MSEFVDPPRTSFALPEPVVPMAQAMRENVQWRLTVVERELLRCCNLLSIVDTGVTRWDDDLDDVHHQLRKVHRVAQKLLTRIRHMG